MEQQTFNIGLWYYRTFFSGLLHEIPDYKEKSVEKKVEKLLKEELEKLWKLGWNNYENVNFPVNQIETTNSFKLVTVYPGLVCGIGYEHELGFLNELKLGFSFDHTSGLPVIPGSSVKGLLRTYFENRDYINYLLTKWMEGDCPESIREYGDSLALLKEYSNWPGIVKDVFEKKSVRKGENISPYETDIFFDAVITNSGNEERRFLADDYVTNHQHEDKPHLARLLNPNPVRFLKIRSGVEFTFNFRLHNTVIDNGLILHKELKKEIFKQILLDFGIGAKTNVGYGQFQT